MAYASNYYNYQVAVIFAIVLLAMLLLAAMVGAIYFICVLRKKKGFNRMPSVFDRNRYGGGNGNWPPPQQVAQPPYTSIQNHEQTSPQVQEYPRSQPSPYSAAAATGTYNTNQSFQSQQYQPQQQRPLTDPRMRDVQPEYVYQQGPTTWTTTSQVRADYPINPTITETNTGYHMSSV